MKLKINIPRWLERLFVAPVLYYRRLRYGYRFRLIRLIQPRYAIVDPEDYDELRRYEWVAFRTSRNFYARRRVHVGLGRYTFIQMHKQLVSVPEGCVIDHVNYNGVDNRRANLRPASHAENMRHRKKFSGRMSSRYKGVSWRKDSKNWVVKIGVNSKSKHLGSFNDEVEAAKVYDAAAKKYHGEFACLNFPE